MMFKGNGKYCTFSQVKMCENYELLSIKIITDYNIMMSLLLFCKFINYTHWNKKDNQYDREMTKH